MPRLSLGQTLHSYPYPESWPRSSSEQLPRDRGLRGRRSDLWVWTILTRRCETRSYILAYRSELSAGTEYFVIALDPGIEMKAHLDILPTLTAMAGATAMARYRANAFAMVKQHSQGTLLLNA